MNRLDQGSHRPLTLVSAPAGSGKTTLLAAWVAQRPSQDTVQWLALETGDDRPDRFWALFLRALSRCGRTLADELAIGARRPNRRVLTRLSVALSHLVIDTICSFSQLAVSRHERCLRE